MSRNYIPCISWVARGVAKSLPEKIQLSSEELKQLVEETKNDIRERYEAEETASNAEESENDELHSSEKESSNNNSDIEAKYNLDTYDDDDENKPFLNIGDVVMYVDNKDDEYISQGEEVCEDEQEEEEDFNIKKNDNLLVVGRVKEDEDDRDGESDSCAVLEIYVYNKDEDSLYVHHDIVLPAWPLVLEWLDYHPSDDAPGNYVATGDMTPVIKIYDLDVVNILEPDMCLGEKTKKKDKHKKHQISGHKDAVLSLSWNRNQRQFLASGSADTNIILWDLEEGKVRTKLADQHSGRVQGLQWNLSDNSLLLSGCSDGFVKLYDSRVHSAVKSWKVEGEIEKVCWNSFDMEKFYCATDLGFVHAFSMKNDAEEYSQMLHSKGITDLDMSKFQKNILLTASEDKTVKLWNVESGFKFLRTQKLKLGSIYTAKFAPDSDMVAVGGNNKANNLKVLDILKTLEGLKLETSNSNSLLATKKSKRETTQNSLLVSKKFKRETT